MPVQKNGLQVCSWQMFPGAVQTIGTLKALSHMTMWYLKERKLPFSATSSDGVDEALLQLL